MAVAASGVYIHDNNILVLIIIPLWKILRRKVPEVSEVISVVSEDEGDVDFEAVKD